MPPVRQAVIHAVLAAAFLAAACGGGSADDSAEGSATSSDARATASGGEEAAPDFSAAELAAYERGMARELEVIRAADAASDTATTADSRNALREAKDEMHTIAAGAAAAGLAEDRYAAIRGAIHATMRMLDYQGRIDGPTSYDTSRADAAMRERLARDPYTELPARAAAALRAREEPVAAQWGDYVRLTAVGG